VKANALGLAAAANLLLAAGLVFLWHDPQQFRWAEPAPIKPLLGDFVAATGAPAADVSQYRETVERPLFASTRRPAPRDAAGGGDKPVIDPLKDVRLLGLYGAGSRGGTVVNFGGKVQRVPYGGKIGDWTVAGEDGRGATLVDSRGERRHLQMAMITDAAAAAAPGDKRVETPVAVPSASAAPARPAGRGRAAARNVESEEQRNQRVRAMADRWNAVRAQRGMPPTKE